MITNFVILCFLYEDYDDNKISSIVARYADLANHAETAGQANIAEKAQKAKISDFALKAVYSVLAESAEFALKLRRNPVSIIFYLLLIKCF